MSVLPQFLEHIHNTGIYVDGFNYEEMYNIMVYNLTYNVISTNNFVYSYAQMNQLYNYLEELLMPDLESYIDIEPETNPSININTITQPTNQDTLQLFNNYIITALNNQYNQNLNNTNMNNTNMNNTNMNNTNMNNTNMNSTLYTNNNEFTYTNLVYHNVL